MSKTVIIDIPNIDDNGELTQNVFTLDDHKNAPKGVLINSSLTNPIIITDDFIEFYKTIIDLLRKYPSKKIKL